MMQDGMMDGGMGGWMFLSSLLWILLVVALIVLVAWAVQRTFLGPRREESAIETLKKRYARGEISKEEYEERKRDLD